MLFYFSTWHYFYFVIVLSFYDWSNCSSKVKHSTARICIFLPGENSNFMWFTFMFLDHGSTTFDTHMFRKTSRKYTLKYTTTCLWKCQSTCICTCKVHVHAIYIACVRAIYNTQRRDLYVLHFSLYREYKIKIGKCWIDEI